MAELALRARRAGTLFAEGPGERVALVDLNSEAVPIALFGASLAGKPFVPINYRSPTTSCGTSCAAPPRPP